MQTKINKYENDQFIINFCLLLMSQLFNPIQGKLSKMRSSQMLRCVTQPDTTPLKTQSFPESEKQNISLCPFTQHSKQTEVIKNSESSLKKLCVLQRRSIKKEQSINFYRNELNRRKQKYQSQLQSEQQTYEKQLNMLEEELIEKMKQQQLFDEQSCVLSAILENIGDNAWDFGGLEKLSDGILQLLEDKLKKIGVTGSQLLYSKQTTIECKTGDKVATGRIAPAVESTANKKHRLTTRSHIYESEKVCMLRREQRKDNFSFEY